jgi:hypothetical protein
MPSIQSGGKVDQIGTGAIRPEVTVVHHQVACLSRAFLPVGQTLWLKLTRKWRAAAKDFIK